MKQKDWLSDWARKAPKSFFKESKDSVVQETYRDIMNWVNAQRQFTPVAVEEFAKGADGWLAAYCKVNHGVVVTHEDYRPDARSKVLIPIVCEQFGVEYCNAFELLRGLKVRLGVKKR